MFCHRWTAATISNVSTDMFRQETIPWALFLLLPTVAVVISSDFAGWREVTEGDEPLPSSVFLVSSGFAGWLEGTTGDALLSSGVFTVSLGSACGFSVTVGSKGSPKAAKN